MAAHGSMGSIMDGHIGFGFLAIVCYCAVPRIVVSFGLVLADSSHFSQAAAAG